MNTQTERLENHTARLTVELLPERLEQAKKNAAKKIARQVNIPGFRKGKAPYRIIANFIGEGTILEEAIEDLSNEIYKEALDSADIEPFGPGELENIDIEAAPPTFTFVVPLQPTTDLKDYRSVRLDFEEEAVEDAAVDRALESLREQHAVIEESHNPVAEGDNVTMYIHGQLIDEDEADDTEDTEAANAESETEAATDEAADDAEGEAETHDHDHDHDHDDDEYDHPHHHVDENTIIHQHDAVMSLTEDKVPLPGFIEALSGAVVGETREFDLTYPDDEEEYDEMAGKTAHFVVNVQKIENVSLPTLNDDLAARATKDEDEPLTLLQLRLRIRENLQEMSDNRRNAEYAREALDKMTEQAEVSYPELLLTEQIDQMLQQFDRELRQRQGLNLETYMKLTNKSQEDMRDDYRETAEKSIKRSLVMREVMEQEKIEITDAMVDEEIDRMTGNLGEQAQQYRLLFSEPSMRDNIRNDLLNQRVMERIGAIAKGEAPDLSELVAETTTSDEPDDVSKGETAT